MTNEQYEKWANEVSMQEYGMPFILIEERRK